MYFKLFYSKYLFCIITLIQILTLAEAIHKQRPKNSARTIVSKRSFLRFLLFHVLQSLIKTDYDILKFFSKNGKQDLKGRLNIFGFQSWFKQ